MKIPIKGIPIEGPDVKENVVVLTSADAGRILGITPAGIRWLAITGKIPVYATSPGGWRFFKESDILAESRRRQKEKAG